MAEPKTTLTQRVTKSFIAGSKQLQGFTQIKQGHRLEMHLVLLVGLCIFGTTPDLKHFQFCVRIFESKQNILCRILSIDFF